MNLPGAIVNLPTLTEKDVADLTDFGIPQNVDFIAASFVRKGSDIDYIRSVLGEEGSHIKIIAKIEVLTPYCLLLVLLPSSLLSPHPPGGRNYTDRFPTELLLSSLSLSPQHTYPPPASPSSPFLPSSPPFSRTKRACTTTRKS